GLPLGILLYVTANPLLFRIKLLNAFLGALTNVIRSFPFIILIVAIMPLATWLTNSSHGPVFASVALSIASILYLQGLPRQVSTASAKESSKRASPAGHHCSLSLRMC